MADTKNKTGFSAGLILGAVLGGAAALMLAPKTGKEHREFVGKKLKELKANLGEMEVEKRVKEVFGDVSDQSIQFYNDARSELAKKIDTIRDHWDEMDMEKYKELVGEVITQVRDEGNVPSEHVTKLRDYLVEDWKKLAQMEEPPKKKRSPAKLKG